MSERDQYPAGCPCWIDTLQPDPRTAMDFYGPLFGWEFVGGPMPGPPGEYYVARVRGRDVAGIGSVPDPGTPVGPAWTTYVRVDRVEGAVAKATKAGAKLRDGPLDVPPAGRLAVLTDPTGALFGVWEAGSRKGARIVTEPRAWSMSMLQTPDPESAKAFYGAVFGWRAEPMEPPDLPITLLRLPGYVGGTLRQPVPRDVVAVILASGDDFPSAPAWNVDFWVEDADTTAEQAGKLGGDVISGPLEIPRFRTAVLADPFGAVFSVSQLLIPPAGSPFPAR